LNISRVIADGIATHLALKLVGRVGHHIMAAARAAQAKMRGKVFTKSPLTVFRRELVFLSLVLRCRFAVASQYLAHASITSRIYGLFAIRPF
jgi:hypothetical protein